MYQVVPGPEAVEDAMLILNGAEAVCIGLPLSLAVTVNVKVPLVVGDPVISPVEELSVIPAGKLPELTDQV